MAHFLVALIAAIVAYMVNTLVIRQSGLAALVIITPIVEEVVKSLAAIISFMPIVLVHVLFGAIEAVHDLLTGGGLLAALLSILAHSLFGLLTLWAFNWSGNLLPGIALGSGAHLLWNAIVVEGLVKTIRGEE